MHDLYLYLLALMMCALTVIILAITVKLKNR